MATKRLGWTMLASAMKLIQSRTNLFLLQDEVSQLAIPPRNRVCQLGVECTSTLSISRALSDLQVKQQLSNDVASVL